jgi:hypothetical protein
MEKGALECQAPKRKDYPWVIVAIAQGVLRGVGYSVLVQIDKRLHLFEQIISAILG